MKDMEKTTEFEVRPRRPGSIALWIMLDIIVVIIIGALVMTLPSPSLVWEGLLESGQSQTDVENESVPLYA